MVYVDESNINLFLRRTKGRAKVGNRAVVKLPSSKGANVHMVGALSQTGFVSFLRRRGSFKAEDFKMWLRGVCQTLSTTHAINMDSIEIVLDNAPCHSKAEELLADFPGLSICRLAPYSPILNPIEAAWNSIKSYMKNREAESLNTLLSGHLESGLTQTEYRLRYVENLIDEGRALITPVMSINFFNHVQRFYADVLEMKDIPVGQ